MKKQTVESILEEISKDPLFSETNKKLSDEERTKVNDIVKSFVTNFVLPLEQLVEKATKDPEVKEEIRSLIASKESPKNESK